MRKRGGIQGGHTELDVQCNTIATGDQPRSRGTAALGGLKMESGWKGMQYQCT